MAVGYSLYVDGIRVFHSSSAFNVSIEADGFVDETGMAVGAYTYAEGAYLGWTTTQGGTTPDYVVGDTISVGSGIINLYSIPSVTNLTNTKWLFNNEPIMEQFGYLYLNFSSNNTNYTGINIVNASRYIGMQYDLTDAYIGYSEATSSTGWQNEAYKTIEITGGTDATNTDLISWIIANATQIIEPATGGSISVGSFQINKVLLGTIELKSIYIGEIKLYDKETPSGDGIILDQFTPGLDNITSLIFE